MRGKEQNNRTGNEFSKIKQNRYALLDSIRGIVLISMIVYHGAWNLVYIHGIKWNWYHTRSAYIWQQSICWTFLLLSGFCWSLGKRHLRSGLLVFGGGLLVSAVTLLAMPSNKVVFGVLTCIGSCMLLMIVLDKILKKIPSIIGLLGNFFLFLFTKHINRGYLGIGTESFFVLPKSLYQGYFGAYIGFTPNNFYSTDYFSLFPWIFLFLTGYFLYHIFNQKKWLNKETMKWNIPFCAYMGRHSLLIYLLHQPILFLLGSILFHK